MRWSSLRLAVWMELLSAAGLLMAADAPASRQKIASPKSDKKKTDQDLSAFMRVIHDKNNIPVTLQTAIVRYAASNAASPTVDLVAAIHIADAAYYKQLNREFTKYDAVLFEGVESEKPNKKLPQKGIKSKQDDAPSVKPKQDDGPNFAAIGFLENGMKDVLGLEFQLEGIDYTVKNMVHADMSEEQFRQSIKQHGLGDSLLGILAREMAHGMAKEDQRDSGMDAWLLCGRQMLDLMFSKDRTLSLKRMGAEVVADGNDSDDAIESTFVGERNRVAIDVLRKELAAGKKTVAIFYGGGHMPDLQKRLHDEFHMSPVSTRWLTAWNMADKEKTGRLGDRETGKRGDKPRAANPPIPNP